MTTLAQLMAESGLPLPEARMLLERVLEKSRAWLIAHADATPGAGAGQAFSALAGRRRQGEPVAYILGVREFFGMEFCVAPAVLIPRPETELLVDLALERIPGNAAVRVLDLGTGSGAIAIALAHERREARLTAVDIDYAALSIARANASRHGVRAVRRNLRSDRLQPALRRRRRSASGHGRCALRAAAGSGGRRGRPGLHPRHRRPRGGASLSGRLVAVRARLRPGSSLSRTAARAGLPAGAKRR